MLTPRLDILPTPQRCLWDELSLIPPDFVLYGGTALALRLGHRASEDFDFFSNQAFRPDDLERQIPVLAATQRLQSSPNTLVSLVTMAFANPSVVPEVVALSPRIKKAGNG